MMGIAIGVRQLYLPFKVRVRQWGALPPRRGPTVLITNHQYINEGEIVVSRIFLRNPWQPLVMVNSRRTFETGFFAARLPWTARWTRRFNPTGLWSRMSLLPIENHLFSRTLLSLAEEIRARHGDLALEQVLPEERLATLGLSGVRLGELWSMRYFFKAQAVVKIAHLRDPYRREALENFRRNSAADIARIVDTVRAGATFYVTPEGDFSRDGRMHRMRGGITDAVLPFADPWLCAIAYDPFRGRRLSMLHRIVRPADRDDLGASLAAARPVTTSALLATALLEAPAPPTRDDLVAAVTARLRDLPSNVFVDPELQRDIARAVDEGIAHLQRHGTLRGAAGRFTLTDDRSDPRLAHVADMLTYQRNMLAETLACATGAHADSDREELAAPATP